MKTIVQTFIDGDLWCASTPHIPGLWTLAKTESQAIDGLCANLRKRFAAGPVAWDANAKADQGKDIITRELSGLWPVDIIPESPEKPEAPEPAQQTRSDEDGNH